MQKIARLSYKLQIQVGHDYFKNVKINYKDMIKYIVSNFCLSNSFTINFMYLKHRGQLNHCIKHFHVPFTDFWYECYLICAYERTIRAY